MHLEKGVTKLRTELPTEKGKDRDWKYDTKQTLVFSEMFTLFLPWTMCYMFLIEVKNNFQRC